MKDLTVEEICRRINIQANLNDLQSKSIEKRNSALKTLVTITLRALLRRLGFDESASKAITTFSPRMVLRRSSTCNPKMGRGNRTRSNKSGM